MFYRYRALGGAGESLFRLTIPTPPERVSTYYLVVPHGPDSEGSYGVDSSGLERGAGASECIGQFVGPCD